MCGILGLLSKDIDKTLVKKATNLMQHRGPDDSGFFFDKEIALGHRRLSVIDLSKKASQPMCNKKGDLWIIFNGEIYNFQELRKELEKKYEFNSKSDTEVILHAYEEWGEECVKRFNGMFSFAIWDTKKKELFLARDRSGEKPLYYWNNGDEFIFASEVKAILQFVDAKINKKILYDYFNYFMLTGEETLFQGIFSLPAAHYFKIKKEKNKIKIERKRYWDVEYKIENKPESFFVSELRGKIRESIERRLISDVPIGAFISGGIDSSIIVAFMKKLSDEVKTFCVGSGDELELKNARFVAQHFNTDHHEILISSEDFAKNLKKMIWHYDMPISFASSVPLYFVSKMTKGKATVVLTGEGADELFAGYSRYRHMSVLRKESKYFKWIPKAIKNYVINSIPDPRYKKNWDMLFNGFNPEFATGINIFFGKERQEALAIPPQNSLKPEVIRNFNENIPPQNSLKHDVISNFNENIPQQSSLKQQVTSNFNEKKTEFLNKLLYLDFRTYLVELLMKQDKMSMAASIESRVPFLDPGIIQLSSRMPINMKLRGKEGKYILKRAMHGILPKQVIYQKKIGFPVPINRWFKQELSGFVKDNLLGNEIIKEYFNENYIRKLIERQKTQNCSLQLWALLNFKLWHEQFIG